MGDREGCVVSLMLVGLALLAAIGFLVVVMFTDGSW